MRRERYWPPSGNMLPKTIKTGTNTSSPLSYAYNTSVHEFTNLSPFGRVLSRHLHGSKTVSHSSIFKNDSHVKTDSQWLRIYLKRKIATFQTEANTHIRKRKVQYKYYHDKKMLFKPKLFSTQWTLMNKLPLAISKNTAARKAMVSHNQTQRR